LGLEWALVEQTFHPESAKGSLFAFGFCFDFDSWFVATAKPKTAQVETCATAFRSTLGIALGAAL
jgi:hypothetical protein